MKILDHWWRALPFLSILQYNDRNYLNMWRHKTWKYKFTWTCTVEGYFVLARKNTSSETIFEPYISCMNNFPMSKAKALMQHVMNLNINILWQSQDYICPQHWGICRKYGRNIMKGRTWNPLHHPQIFLIESKFIISSASLRKPSSRNFEPSQRLKRKAGHPQNIMEFQLS